MGQPLDKITISGFKSIRSLENFELKNLNILVGANGSGKSNFVSFFRMLRAMAEGGLDAFVTQNGGADGFFFNGPKETPSIRTNLIFGINGYAFELVHTASNQLMVQREYTLYKQSWTSQGGGGFESQLKTWENQRSLYGPYRGVEAYIYAAVIGWIVYHFHDTSMLAPMRREHPLRNNREFNPDAANIAPFLLRLKNEQTASYGQILDTIRLVAPFFDNFILEPEKLGPNEVVRLEWRQKGSSFPYQPWQLSDGTLRFICLATALLQPNPASTIVIDEPELGLHPFALSVLAGLMRDAASRTQVIVSTQSVTLLDHFSAGDIIVVDREKGASIFRRLDENLLKDWLKDYSIGELWQKNVFDGGPTYE